MNDDPPVSLGTEMELQEILGTRASFTLLRLAKTFLKIAAVLVLVLGLAELFVVAANTHTKLAPYESMTTFAIAWRVVQIAAQAFALAVGAQLIGLWLTQFDLVRAIRDRVESRT